MDRTEGVIMYGSSSHAGHSAVSGAGMPGASMPEVPQQIEHLEKMLAACHDGLTGLEQRLQATVMRPAPPECENKPHPEPISSSVVGGRLRDSVRGAAQLNARIQSLTARLEV